MGKRTELLALLLVVALILAIATLSRRDDLDMSQSDKHTVIRSSYRTFPEGYKALYDTLAAHYPVTRSIRPFSLLPARGLLIVADPYQRPITEYEGRRLIEWVRAGNHALILTERHPRNLFTMTGIKVSRDPDMVTPVIQAKGQGEDSWRFWDTNPWWKQVRIDENITTRPANSIAPSFLAAAAPSLSVASSFRFPADAPLPAELAKLVDGTVPLYRDTGGVAVAYSTVGPGGIVWCASPWSFSNAGLATGTNLDFILALANLQPGAPVIFDEYHQGYGADMMVWNLAPPLVKLGLGQLALALLLLLFTIAWRFGPSRLPDDERFPRSRAEYLTAMAALLEHARATHVVRERLSVLLRRDLGRRLNVPPHAPLERFTAANAQRQAVDQVHLERITRQLTVMETQHRPDPLALLRLSGEVHRLLHRK